MRPLQEDAETTRQPPRTPAHGAPAAGALQLPVLRARLLQPRAAAPPRADHAHGVQGGGSSHVSGVRQGHAQKHAQETRQVGIKTRVREIWGSSSCLSLFYGTDYRRLTEH